MICIVSPHLDDAALSCADHAREWRARGDDVLVVNVFTDVGDSADLSPPMASALHACGAMDPTHYAAMRLAEDSACLSALDLRSACLGLVDAGFRTEDGRGYPTLSALRPGRLGQREASLVDRLAAALHSFHATRVISPMGIGGHVDHLVARAACERLVPANRITYYADMPYARAPWRWRGDMLRRLLLAPHSVKPMSSIKRNALLHYRSQLPLLFRRGLPSFPEIVISPRRGN